MSSCPARSPIASRRSRARPTIRRSSTAGPSSGCAWANLTPRSPMRMLRWSHVPNMPAALYTRGIARLRKGDREAGERDLAAARRLVFDIDATYRGLWRDAPSHGIAAARSPARRRGRRPAPLSSARDRHVGRSARSALWNADLAPTTPEQRTWAWYHYAVALGRHGHVLSRRATRSPAGLIDQGISAVAGGGYLLLGNAIVLVPMLLIGHAGAKYGIPYRRARALVVRHTARGCRRCCARSSPAAGTASRPGSAARRYSPCWHPGRR